jgi:hypothetical protein
MQIRSVGIDLGKTTFHLVALGDNGKVLLEEEVYPEAVDCLHREPAGLLNRDGSMFGVALPRPGFTGTRP